MSKAGFVCLTRRGGQVGPRHGAIFRADQYRGAAHLVALLKAPLGADPLAGPRRHAVEVDLAALIRLMDAGAFQIVDDDLREIDLRRPGTPALSLGGIEILGQFGFVSRGDAVRRQALDRERAGDPTRPGSV